MVFNCAAYGCNNTYKAGVKRSFHRFPLSNKPLLSLWLRAVRRKNFFPSRHHALCSDHFEKKCFHLNYVNRSCLKEDAVPTIFNFSEHLLENMVKSRWTSISQRSLNGTEEICSNFSSLNCMAEHLTADSSLNGLKGICATVSSPEVTPEMGEKERIPAISSHCHVDADHKYFEPNSLSVLRKKPNVSQQDSVLQRKTKKLGCPTAT